MNNLTLEDIKNSVHYKWQSYLFKQQLIIGLIMLFSILFLSTIIVLINIDLIIEYDLLINLVVFSLVISLFLVYLF